MNDCRNCGHRIFDEVWGEYKCKLHEHRIYDLDKYIDCPGHTNAIKKEEDKTNA